MAKLKCNEDYNIEENILRYTLRIDRELFQKFRYVAEFEGRSANKEFEQFVKKHVKAVEDNNGEIKV